MLSFKQIKIEEVIQIRHTVLRKDLPIETCHFEGDLDEGTKHFGAFLNNELVGVATMMLKKTDTFKVHPVYRLTGLSVLENHQKHHIGSRLLHFAEENISRKGSVMIWCFARTTAISFYKRNGYQLNVQEVILPKIGSHRIMFKFVPKEE
ncbi:GNAT family N-acetyltransferase [Flavobacterium sp. xlx-214]|uniref:GNAT family N-acetyltransferase n=1 Tax=unclassified Flavobacterium TaxID=196869 RepID=UPI0013D437EE|nr:MULTISPECIES: GNAT family N-acetyltransferase [unclassified Flavobacterium]MBA5792326.1 GNAT family N-acetyltransferase [Flavobacterium sp. xlx-221]QMI82359.1 GNAT family N-acetyltransferase [Flavobacterium sp. xlx-214]